MDSAMQRRDDPGFFGPGSAVWAVDRETAVLLGSGQRALLMQVAHPQVAAGVAAHSRYASDPLGRLWGTLEAIYTFAFADTREAKTTIDRVNRLHTRVRGTLPTAVGCHPAGEAYSALEPTLMLWVYATLIDSSLLAYRHLVRPLPVEEEECYYAEMRWAGPAWGIPEELFPSSVVALRAWMEEVVKTGYVAVSEQGREVGRSVLRPPAWWIPAPAMWPVSLIGLWLLPAALREQFGYTWGPRRERAARLLAGASRVLVPYLPPLVRHVPWARAAARRVGHQHGRPSPVANRH